MRKNIFQVVKASAAAVIISLLFVLVFTLIIQFCSLSVGVIKPVNQVFKILSIIAVGTTSVRTLESACDENGNLKECSGNTQIFIYPPYKFKCVDALITNFHLPESTLIMLVAAMCGREEILNVYKTAVNERYRFFSFGDAMLVL